MKIGILGCGQMGEIILQGLMTSKKDRIDSIIATTKRKNRTEEIQKRFPQISVTQDNSAAARDSDIVILCTKPPAAKDLLQSIKDDLKGKLLISICAGVTNEDINGWTEDCQVVRAMPNTPCVIGEGTVVISPSATSDEKTVQLAKELFDQMGLCMVLDERHLDVVTALASAGPAFAFVILEALGDGAVMMGLPREAAKQIAAQMFQGAARLLLQSGNHPAALKDEVTTPGGCTIAGLLIMEDGRIRSTLARAIQEATTVAGKLGAE